MITLADVLGFSPEDVEETLGSGWQSHPSKEHQYFFIKEAEFGPDLVLMAQSLSEREIRVGVGPAIGRWVSVGEITYDIEPGVMIEQAERGSSQLLDLLGRHASHSSRMRRGSLRTCMYCNQATAPEFRFEPGVCQACASRHLGVVF